MKLEMGMVIDMSTAPCMQRNTCMVMLSSWPGISSAVGVLAAGWVS